MNSNDHESSGSSSPEICRPTLVRSYQRRSENTRKLFSYENRRGLEFDSPYEKCPFSLAADEKTKKKAEKEFDAFSNEEIKNDFMGMKTKSEILEVRREILSILRNNSTASNSITNNDMEEKCERVHNPFFKNLQGDD